MRYHYAQATSEIDQSNYYRLLKEADLRQKIKSSYPDFDNKLEKFFLTPDATSFLQAEPKNMTGSSSEIALSNSVIERKIILKRLAEACLNPVADPKAIEAIEKDLGSYTGHLGIDQPLAERAAVAAKNFATALKSNAQPSAAINPAPRP